MVRWAIWRNGQHSGSAAVYTTTDTSGSIKYRFNFNTTRCSRWRSMEIWTFKVSLFHDLCPSLKILYISSANSLKSMILAISISFFHFESDSVSVKHFANHTNILFYRQFCMELNGLAVRLQVECQPKTCTQMTATEQWIFLCAAHKTPKECPAIDYTRHTLDGAACLLNSNKYFPSR